MRIRVHRVRSARRAGPVWARCVLALCAAVCCVLVCSASASAAQPVIGEVWAADVASSSATLQAQIDPEGTETTYRFEYGTSASYGASVPLEGESVGSGSGVVVVQAHLQELLAGTTYHYRVIASGAGVPVDGKDHTFMTQVGGGEFTLPDGRQYELVSPALKDGAEILGIGGGGETAGGGDATQASEAGTSVTYIANAPVGTNLPGNTWSTQILATRGPEGWSRRTSRSTRARRGNLSGDRGGRRICAVLRGSRAGGGAVTAFDARSLRWHRKYTRK